MNYYGKEKRCAFFLILCFLISGCGNGKSEVDNIKESSWFINSVDGIQRTSIYYCDPMRSGQKGGLEQAHTMLRMVLPKGTSFEFLTQWDVNLIVSYINSTPRESLGGKTPYSVAFETMGEDVLNAFQLRPIAPDEVNLTPKLIRFNH